MLALIHVLMHELIILNLQLFDNAMVTAGLVEDARPMINRLNELLTKVLEKH